MKIIIKSLMIIISFIIILSCKSQKKESFISEILYKFDNLIITRISEDAFIHTSFLQTNDFGNVPCNGLVVRNSNEVIIFDTPTNDKSSEELIQWITEINHFKINAIIPTHFHNDCLGGLKTFNENNIPSYAYIKTVELAKENNFVIPNISFLESIILKVGDEEVFVKFFGEGHTKDNVVGYFPKENIIFGGCLIKEKDASKGYLGDSNISAWSNTVEKIKKEYPDVKIVVPGHGNYGDLELLDYTINLFKAQ